MTQRRSREVIVPGAPIFQAVSRKGGGLKSLEVHRAIGTLAKFACSA
jgi:hypothetical protein